MKKLILVGLIFSVISCGGSKYRSGSTEEFTKEPKMPSFILTPPSSVDSLYGVGFAKKQNPMLAKKAAPPQKSPLAFLFH